MSYQEISEAQISPEVPINENMAALGQGFVFSHDVTADTGLVVGITGGTFDVNTVADTTVTCTDDATNYVVAHRTTRAVSTATATTNWDDTATYGRVGRAVFAAGVLTWFDERQSTGGIFDHTAAVASGVSSVNGESGAVTLDAGDIGITDAGTYFTGTDVEAALQEIGAALGAAGAQPFDALTFYPGLPTASAILLRVPVARAVGFVANFAGSYGTASAAATASTAFDIQKNGASIGTATFALGATTATFVSAAGAAQSLVAGDVLSVIAPGTPDATLANVGFVLAGTR